MIEEIKKSYNPFKMWGSWVGAVIGFLFVFIVAIVFFLPARSAPPTIIEKIYDLGGAIGYALPLLLIVLPGFLIGWATHSLIRKYKK